MKKINLILVLVLASFVILSRPVGAITVIKLSDLSIDNSVVREDENFNLQKKIVVIPIFNNLSSTSLNDRQFYRGLYYYTIQKLGFNDIPFHYIISEKGNVFEGNSGGAERRIRIGGIGDDVIVIGYLTKKTALKFDSRAFSPLTDLLLEVANKNAIKPDQISVSGIRFVRNTATKSVAIEEETLTGLWNNDIKKIRASVSNRYKPVGKKYVVALQSVELPKGQVAPGENVPVKVTVRNDSEFGIYAGTDSEIILSLANGAVSKFFLNNVWISTSQIALLEEDSILLPKQSKAFEFYVKAPLYAGEVSEKFELKNAFGDSISTKSVTLKLNMKRSSKQIVEIQNTPTGALNVRSTPSSFGNVVSQVSPGERFFLTDDAGNGWIEIQLSDGKKGWVARWLVNFI